MKCWSLKCWVSEQFENNYVFAQDRTPSHTSNMTQKWCKDHYSSFLHKNVWPPSSPDIKPINFAIWSILKNDVFAKSFPNIEALKDALRKFWAALDEILVKDSCFSVFIFLNSWLTEKEVILKFSCCYMLTKYMSTYVPIFIFLRAAES